MTLRAVAFTFAWLILLAVVGYNLLALTGCSISGGGYHAEFLKDTRLTLETNHDADPNAP